MSWASRSCPDAEAENSPEATARRRKFHLNFKPEGPRPEALQLSLSRMCKEGFYQCLRCCKISHTKFSDCPRCGSVRVKQFPPALL
jgi:hypothetical protein